MARKNDEEKPANNLPEKEPETAPEFVERGWDHYSRKEYFRSEADFQKALDLLPDDVDTLYALGMTQHASGRLQEAVKTFEKTIQILESPSYVDSVRSHMLIRLARGHINRIQTGDWKLEV